MADIIGQNPPGGSTPNIQGSAYEGETADDRQALLDAHHRNVSLGLLAAGLGMMAAQGHGRRRASFGQALGEGGLMGLQTYESGEEATAKTEQARVNQRGVNAYRQADLGLKERNAESLVGYRKDLTTNAAARDKATAASRQETSTNAAARLAEQARHDKADEGNAAAGKGIEASKLGIEQARLGIEQGKQAPIGVPTATSLLRAYGIPNADEMGKHIGELPREDAMKLINTAVVGLRDQAKADKAAQPKPVDPTVERNRRITSVTNLGNQFDKQHPVASHLATKDYEKQRNDYIQQHLGGVNPDDYVAGSDIGTEATSGGSTPLADKYFPKKK